MATYRIGPTGLFTNEDLKADALTLDTQVNRLDDLPMEEVSETFFDAWIAFWSEWKKFYANTILGSFFGPAWNDANRDQLIQFENRFEALSVEYAAQTGKTILDVTKPGTGPKDKLGDVFPSLRVIFEAYKWVIIGIAVVGVVYFTQALRQK